MGSHKGMYKGEEIACIHTDFGYYYVLFPDKEEKTDKCLIPGVDLWLRTTSRDRRRSNVYTSGKGDQLSASPASG
jgi:hypothetical protein